MKTLNFKTVLITTLITLSSLGNETSAQDNLKHLEYGAYLNNSKTLWKSVVDKRQNIYDETSSPSDLYELVASQHGLLNNTMSDQDEDLFDEYVDEAKDNIEILIDEDYKQAEAKAILSSIYGFEMAYSSWKGMFLGAKSSNTISSAIKLNDQSPLVWQVYANSKLFTPKAFGGNQQEAVESFKKSVELYEEQGYTKNNWRYLDALAWLGQAYQKIGETDKARQTFEKALKVEPEFSWVKHSLLPAIASK